MAQASNEAPVAAPPAGVLRRLGALLYDGLLMLAIWMMSTLIVLPLNAGEAVSGLVFQVLLVAEWAAFNLYFWTRSGQTLGMRAWRLRVVSTEGNNVTLPAATRRLIVAPLSLLCAGLGYVWFYVGTRQQTWHDRFSETYVVELPKASSS